MNHHRTKSLGLPLLAGLIVGLLAFCLTAGIALAEPHAAAEAAAEASAQAAVHAAAHAAPPRQDEPPAEEATLQTTKDCQECHVDVEKHWAESAHANAFSDPHFQERWVGAGEPGECLVCHTTDYRQSTGEFAAEGVQCEACHGETTTNHPPEPVPILADTQYCGSCHTTTLGEWRLTGHSTADIGCSDCHDPHSQQALFAEPDDLCLNCHEESMGDYLEDLHVSKGIGCVDCHALVIPPDEEPLDGIVPTGHAFTITPATCVACHTDALHAGFSLPGYEHGAAAANGGETVLVDDADMVAVAEVDAGADEMTPEQRLQVLEAALASQNTSLLFQGGLVGLVLGGTTAWFVANNIRRRNEDDSNGR